MKIKEIYTGMDKNTIKRLIGNFDKKQFQELIFYIVSVNESAGEAVLL